MCGIAGIVRYDAPARCEESRLLAMRHKLRHRGPDGEGIYVEGHAALAHTRLALLDPERGAQPMLSLDRRYALVYNGEVYNFPELRRELEDRFTFRTGTDTEVVLAACTVWGEASVERLNGMFSFFLWDALREQGFGARDRLGIKPFVYQVQDGALRFASEAKALVDHAPQPRVESIVEYLAAPCFSGVEAPMFAGLRYLPAGHALSFSRRGLRVWRYWDYELEADLDADPEGLAGELLGRLTAAVGRTQVADFPVGLFLSGGLDSTLLGALARPAPLSFTVRFEEQESYDYTRSLIVKSDDLPYARLAAQELGLEQRLVAVERSGLVEDLKLLAAVNDALPAWEQEFAQYHLSRHAAQHLKAVLVGDTADETHFGYSFLLDEVATCSPGEVLRRFGSAPVRRELVPELPSGGSAGGDPAVYYFDAKYRSLTEAAGYDWSTPRGRVLATTYLVVKRWLARLLHNGDVHTMAWSLEARVPFADVALLDLARRIDPGLGLRRGVEKWLLRRAASGIVPPAICRRPKSALPKDQNVAACYQQAVAGVLRESPEFVAAFLDMEAIEELLDPRRHLSEPQRMLLFRVLALAFWARHYGVKTP